MIEETINIKIFWNRNENETLQNSKMRLQQELINKGYRLAGDTIMINWKGDKKYERKSNI